jgi:hypothetical protein
MHRSKAGFQPCEHLWFRLRRKSQGLKPRIGVGLEAWAKAQAYLRSNDKAQEQRQFSSLDAGVKPRPISGATARANTGVLRSAQDDRYIINKYKQIR